jgi:hypothetical protein
LHAEPLQLCDLTMHTNHFSTAPTDALLALLARWQHLAPEYQEGLSNHLPMALHALHSLGADEARLTTFADHYVKRFHGTPATAPGKVLPHWQAHRGDFSRYADLHATFAAVIKRQGAQHAMQEVLPDLWPGVAAAAFHGLIRTAHAWEMAHDDELACGLAYWASRWQPTKAVPFADGLPFDAWAATLSEHVVVPRPAGRLISERIEQVQTSAAFARLSSSMLLTPDTPRQLAWFAADHYSRSGNFTLLHMVTGCRAARMLLTAAKVSPQAALLALVPAFTAAFLASGLERNVPLTATEPDESSWSGIASTALRSNDDHIAKIVHACFDEGAAYARPAYLQAARRAIAARC